MDKKMNPRIFDWVPFYEEFAQKLLKYKNNRDSLLDKLEKVEVKEFKEPIKIIQKEIKDIDPFTIMGIIHKKRWPMSPNSTAKRKKILQEIREVFKINAPVPTNNDGVTDLTSAQGKSPYYYFGVNANFKDRQNNINVIWNLFENILKYASKPNEQLQKQIIDDMRKVVDIDNNGVAKVTMALYWFVPKVFLSLDSTNYLYITEHQQDFSDEIIDLTKAVRDNEQVEQYFELLKKVDNICVQNNIDFKELSEKAYVYVDKKYKKPKKEKKKEKEENTKYSSKEKEIENIKKPDVVTGGKNIIVYGVPGSGKSFYIENQLKETFGLKKGYTKNDKKYKEYRECVERVIFYPEYTYYDFVGQKVPSADGGLIFEPGNFTKILEKALKNKDKNYYLVIEELNRGNAEAIFGDVFQLLDREPSGESTYSIDNNFLKEYLTFKGVDLTENEIRIPSNLTIYATINNADQNVFNFDTAFGRRWDYQMMSCDPKKENKDITEGSLFETGTIKGTNIKWNELRTKINYCILENKNEIYNAEEKRLGLYYINLEWLTDNDHEKNDEVVKAFAAKLFRYLCLNVFKNNTELMFRNIDPNILENYIESFVNAKKKDEEISKLLNIELESKKNEND